MKYRSKKGTLIDIPDGLTPRQISSIKADADSGYGTRAQETANKLGKTPGKVKIPKNEYPAEGQPLISKNTIDPKTGAIDAPLASQNVSNAENSDINTNFKNEHPQLITDANGNTREITRHADGTVTVKDTKGGTAQTFTDLATAAAQSFNGGADRQRAEEASYNTLTKYYDRDMSRELEAQKQELAQRGIPYDPAAAQDPNSQSLYGKTIGAIGQKYQGLKDSASQQAILSGNQAYATDSASRDSFLNAVTQGASTFGGNFGQYSNSVNTDSSQDTKDILSMSAQQYATLHGLSLAEAQSRRDDATRRAAIAKSGSGGGGGGGSAGGNAGAGFEIVG